MSFSKQLPFLLFSLIFGLSVFARVFQLNQTPPSLYSDEVDAGYQAYTLNKCGTDYFGNRLPVHFHSYSDWHTPTLIYSIAFFQRITNYSDLAVRLPSVILGVLGCVSVFFLIRQLFDSPYPALFGFFLMAVSPWHIHYSRSTFESLGGMLLFITLGLTFWFKYLKTSRFADLSLSLISLVLSLYFYSTARLFIPLLLLVLVILWSKQLMAHKVKNYLVLALILLVAALPLLADTLKGNTSYRFSYINIFTDPTTPASVDYARFEDAVMDHGQQIGLAPDFKSKLFHNRPLVWLQHFGRNYLASFSTQFLFLEGDGNLRQGFGQGGYLYFPDLLFVVVGIGLVFVVSKTTSPLSKASLFFLLILLLAPIPSSLTRDSNTPHATRLILMLPSLVYFSVLGFRQILKFVRMPKAGQMLASAAVVMFYMAGFAVFWHHYRYHYPNLSARYWHSGMKEAVLAAAGSKNPVYFSDRYEPFLPFFLYYSKYTPKTNCNTDSAISHVNNSFFSGRQIDNRYYFGRIDWNTFAARPPAGPVTIVAPQEDKLQAETAFTQAGLEFSLDQIDTPDYTESEKLYLIQLK